jgi:hypothetical protein
MPGARVISAGSAAGCRNRRLLLYRQGFIGGHQGRGVAPHTFAAFGEYNASAPPLWCRGAGELHHVETWQSFAIGACDDSHGTHCRARRPPSRPRSAVGSLGARERALQRARVYDWDLIRGSHHGQQGPRLRAEYMTAPTFAATSNVPGTAGAPPYLARPPSRWPSVSGSIDLLRIGHHSALGYTLQFAVSAGGAYTSGAKPSSAT